MKLAITFWLKGGGTVDVEDWVVWPGDDTPSPKDVGSSMAATGGLRTTTGGWVFCDDQEIVACQITPQSGSQPVPTTQDQPMGKGICAACGARVIAVREERGQYKGQCSSCGKVADFSSSEVEFS